MHVQSLLQRYQSVRLDGASGPIWVNCLTPAETTLPRSQAHLVHYGPDIHLFCHRGSCLFAIAVN